MEHKLLLAMSLCAVTSSTLPMWAADHWDNPSVETIVADLENGGTYYIYHPATRTFMVNGNDYNTRLSLGERGKKIIVQKGEDKRFGVSGWTMEMPDAPSNNLGKPKYLFAGMYQGGTAAFVDFNMQNDAHYIWKITKNENDDTYRIKLPDEDPVYGLEAEDGYYANSYMGWANDGDKPASEGMLNTIVNPIIDKTSAGYFNAEIDWAFVAEDEYAVYEAKLELKEALEYAVEKGYSEYGEYEALYNGTEATPEELKSAAKELVEKVDDYLFSQASDEHPIDLTNRIANASFDQGTDGWTAVRDPYNNGQDNFGIQSASHPTTDGAEFKNFFERWNPWAPQPNWSVSQVIKDLPQGKYKLTAHASAGDADPTGLYVIADGGVGEQRQEVTEKGTVDGQWAAMPYTLEFDVVSDEVMIGFRVLNTQGNFACVDNFKLLYCGKPDNFVRNGLQKTIDEALAYKEKLENDDQKYSNVCKEEFEKDIKNAQDCIANQELTDDSLVKVRVALVERMDLVREDVRVYSEVLPFVDDKLKVLIDDYEPYYELTNNPEAFVKIYDYADQVETEVNGGEFDSSKFGQLGHAMDSLFREDILDMVKAGITDDLYGLIQSPDFTNNNVSGWAGWPAANNNVGEKYNTWYNVNQVLENLPNGAYKVTMKGFCRPGENNELIEGWDDGITNNIYATLYGNDNAVAIRHLYSEGSDEPYIKNEDGTTWDLQIPVIENKYVPNNLASCEVAFSQGKYLNEVKCVVTDGTLRIGVRMEDERVLAGNWTTFDEFRVTYLGEDVEAYVATVQKLVQDADQLYQALSNVEIMGTADAIQKLETALVNANAVIANPDIEKAKASIEELNEAIAYANESVSVVDELDRLVLDIYNVRGPKYEAAGYNVQEVYDICDEVTEKITVNAIETIEKAQEYIFNINTVCTKIVQDALAGDASIDNPANMTELIVNPDFTIFNEETGEEKNSGEGWTVEVDGGTHTANHKEYEFWNNNSFDFYQKIYGLRPGYYRLVCNGYYREGGSALNAAAAHRDGTETLNAQLYAQSDDKTYMKPVMSIIEDGQPEPMNGDDFNVADSLTTEENPIETWYVPNQMWAAQKFFEKDLYHNEVDFQVVEGQTEVQIGIRKEVWVDSDWTIFDTFRLYYFGDGDENAPDGVEGISAGEATVLRSVYYTLDGTRIDKPAKRGFYIRKDEMSDGTVKAFKFMFK